MPTNAPTSPAIAPYFATERLLEAATEKVFRAWANERQLAQWWGPEGFANSVCTLAPHPGGRIHIEMRGPDGTVHPVTGVIHEVKAPTRLTFDATTCGAQGQPLSTLRTSLRLNPMDGDTLLRLEAHVLHEVSNIRQHLPKVATAWEQSLDQLATFLRTF